MAGDVSVTVVISARDASSTLGDTLDGLQAQEDAPRFEVIVVDNGSSDGTAEIAKRHPLGARVMTGEGKGAGVARNLAARDARGSWLAFTDADCVPTPRWLSEGLRVADRADVIQGLVRPPPGVPVGPFDRTLWVMSEYGLYETANLFVRREIFDELGGFTDWADVDEDASRRRGMPTRPFGEDAWLGWRARRSGARTVFNETAVVFHVVFPGSARRFMEEQIRLRYFPALLRMIPELRDGFAWRRYFLNKQTAAFDVMVLGVCATAAFRTATPLVLAIPYLVLLGRTAGRFPTSRSLRVKLAAATILRDAVGFAALIEGSVRARSPLF